DRALVLLARSHTGCRRIGSLPSPGSTGVEGRRDGPRERRRIAPSMGTLGNRRGRRDRDRSPAPRAVVPEAQEVCPERDGVGLALVIPCFNSISMFMGALIAYVYAKINEQQAERYTIPVASGIIAGESLLGVAVALLAVVGYLD